MICRRFSQNDKEVPEVASPGTCFSVRFMGLFTVHFDPYVYPYGDLQRFTVFSSKSPKPLKIKGFAYTHLQHFHPCLKFKSLLPRQRNPWNRNGSRDFCCPLTLTLTLTGIFAGLPGHLADKLLHALGGLLAHLLGNVAVYIQGEAGRGVAQIALHSFDIVAALDGRNCIAVT